MAADPVGTPPGTVPGAAPGPAVATAARAIAVGRIAIGGALVVAPGIARSWLGDRVASSAGGRVAVRGLGARDIILGAITLHTLSHPQVGPRWLATCALADVADGAATWAARRDLPPAAGSVVALAAGAAAGQLALAALLRRG